MKRRTGRPSVNWPRDIGVVLMLGGLVFAGAMSIATVSRAMRLYRFVPVTAQVIQLESLCEMSIRTSAKSTRYELIDVISCDGTEAYKAAHTGSWKSRPVDYVTLAFDTAAGPSTALLPAAKLAEPDRVAGAQTSIRYDPADPADIETGFQPLDIGLAVLWLLGGLGAFLHGRRMFRSERWF